MAALTRITHKIFGGTGASSNFGKFGSALAGSAVTTKDITTIMALAAWDAGWQSAVVGTDNVPTLEEMNGLLYAHSYQTAYLFQSGIPEYDAATTYHTGSVVRVGAYWYISLQNDNLNNTPPAAASNAWWTWANSPVMPAGMILDYGGISAPAGFGLCDGGTDSRADQAALFAALSVVKACNITNGSPVVTGIDTTAGFGPGQYVEGTGIPAGTRILTVDSGTQVTLNANATSTAAISMRMSPWGLGDGATTFNRPDFRRKMAYGAGSGVAAGATGGVETVTLTAAQSGVPAHTHQYEAWQNDAGSLGAANGSAPSAGLFATTANTPQNASAAHDNMPPYLVCTKIVKY